MITRSKRTSVRRKLSIHSASSCYHSSPSESYRKVSDLSNQLSGLCCSCDWKWKLSRVLGVQKGRDYSKFQIFPSAQRDLPRRDIWSKWEGIRLHGPRGIDTRLHAQRQRILQVRHKPHWADITAARAGHEPVVSRGLHTQLLCLEQQHNTRQVLLLVWRQNQRNDHHTASTRASGVLCCTGMQRWLPKGDFWCG